MPSFAISKFTVLLGPLWVSAVFLLLSTGPLLDIIYIIFLICAEAIPVLFLFLRYRGGGKCRDKKVSKNAGRIFLPFRLHTILLRLQYCSILMAARFPGGTF